MGGRGCGKTVGAATWALSQKAGSVGLIVAPTHNNLLSGAMAVLLSLAYSCGFVKSHNSQTGELRLVDGKLIYLRSLDRPDLIKGMTVSWFWADEMQTVAEKKAWDIIIGCVRGPAPRQRLVTANPPLTGIRHWLHEVFVENAIPGRHRVIIGRTADNPYNPAEYESELRHEYSEAYAASQLDGKWIDVGAVQVYPMDKIRRAQRPPPELTRSGRGWDTAASAGKGDYTAGLLMSIGPDGHLYIRDVVRGQWAPSERDGWMLSTAEADKADDLAAGGTVTTIVKVPQERGGSGKSQAEYWIRDTLKGFNVSVGLESGDKVVRAGPLAAQIGVGNVTITQEPGRWGNYWHDGKRLSPEAAVARFIRNMANFPIGRTKDESDAAAQALQAVRKKASPVHL